MIRITLVAFFLVCFSIFGIPLLLVESLIGIFSKKLKSTSSLRIVQWAFRVILSISGTDATVIGTENIPENEPVLFVGNHRSLFDIPLTYVQCKGLCGYISKKEMSNVPLIKNWMDNLHCLFLDRENLKEGLKTILVAIDQVKQGISIFIFPEGTRNKGEELTLLPFKAGSFKIALKTGCPIIPVSINNASEIFENHFPRIKKTHVIVEYGTPIYPEELDKETKKHLDQYIQNIIQDTIKKNASLL